MKRLLTFYTGFCKRFNKKYIPNIEFKNISKKHKILYKNYYNVDYRNVNKASFMILIFSILILFPLILIIFSLNLIFNILIVFLVSFFIAYRFNIVLFKHLKKEESLLNAICFLIKIDYSLIQKVYVHREDKCLKLIELLINYNRKEIIAFNSLMREIHEGESPEKLLSRVKTTSSDFNKFIQNMLINNFDSLPESSYKGTSERQFRIFINELESKISIIFFIGLFYPIGSCFFILLGIINYISLIILIFLFYLMLYLMNKRFLKSNIILLGLIPYNSEEKAQFDEFIIFLKSLAFFLSQNISHEFAFIKAFEKNKKSMKHLKHLLQYHIKSLTHLSLSFSELINSLKKELLIDRFTLILDLISRMLESNSFKTSDKIHDLIKWLNIHKRYEKKLKDKLQGEKFKVFIFLILLSFITGTVAGLIPHFSIFNDMQFDQINYSYGYIFYFFDSKTIQTIILFISFMAINSITAIYFLKIISFHNKKVIILSIGFYCSVFLFIYFNPIISYL